MIKELKYGPKVVGTKQTLKAIKAGKAKIVFLSKDIDLALFNNIEQLCRENDISISYIDTQIKLGEACYIDRKAATAALLKE